MIEAQETPSAVPRVLLVWSGKGGVGKSTIAVSTALGLIDRGHRVALLDADFHGPSAPALIGADARLRARSHRIVPAETNGLKWVSSGLLAGEKHPNVWHGPLLSGAMDQLMDGVDWGPIDLLVVDLPPGTGETQLELLQRGAWGAVVVTTPTDLSFRDVQRSAKLLHDANVRVFGIVENMSHLFCPTCSSQIRPFSGSAAERLKTQFPGAPVYRVPLELVESDDPPTDLVPSILSRSTTLQEMINTLVEELG